MPVRNSEPKLLIVEQVDIILVTTSFSINMHQISELKDMFSEHITFPKEII